MRVTARPRTHVSVRPPLARAAAWARLFGLSVLTVSLLGATAVVPVSADGSRLGLPVDPPSAARPTGAPSASTSGSDTAPLDTTDRDAVAAAYRDVYLPSVGVSAPARTTQQLQACDPGPQPDELQEAVRTQLNYFRAMSGLQPVSLDPDLSEQAQQAAMIMAANGKLSHQPASTWACYSAVGASAAGSSNLALGVTGSDAVSLYMDDPGASNTVAGHRWWIQQPSTTVMGSGSVASAHALYVRGGFERHASPSYVTWPSAGYFPAALEPAGRWSFFANDAAQVDVDDASVAVRGPDGAALPVTQYPGRNAFGTVVFEVGGRHAPAAGAVDDYQVTVSDLKDDSGALPPYVYDVLVFDPTSDAPAPLVATSAPSISGPAQVGAVLTVQPPTWSVAGAANTYRWYVGDSTVPAGAGQTFTVRASDAGQTLSAEVSGDLPGYHGTARTAPTARVPANPTTLTVTGSSSRPTSVELVIDIGASGLPPFDGEVSVSEDGKALEDVETYSGEGWFDASGFSGGRHDFTVTFAGSALMTPATVTTRVDVAAKIAPTLTLSPRSSTAKKARIDIVVAASGQSPKSKVSILEGTKTLKSGIKVSSSGKARWKGSRLAPGAHTYVVAYAGNATVGSASQSVVTFVQPKLKAYKSCASLRKNFPHGVGMVGARDRTSGTPVTTFFAHDKLFQYNDGKKPRHHKEKDLDPDDDGIACEAG